jgi:hypothetical protein
MKNRLRRRGVGLLPIFALAMVVLLGYAWSISAADEDESFEQISTFPIITFVFPTATRTPTPINVGNFVWDDIDHDGRQDAGEPGISGVQVQLWNSAKNDLIDSAFTNSNGNYTLIAPTPGNYRVRVILPNASLDTFSPKDQADGNDQLDSDINPSGADAGFTDPYVFGSNLISITSIDAGIQIFRTPTPTRTPTPINVGNFVWDDLDLDGQQDAGEPGMAGVQVQLWNSAKTNLIGTAFTNSNGNYTLIAPTPGNYRVRVLLPTPALDTFTTKDQAGGNDQLDSDIHPSGADAGFTDTYVFASNLISITSIDAGIRRFKTPTPTFTPTPTSTPTPLPISIGDFVWRDLDTDGTQDGGEPGMSGLAVELWNGAKTTLFDSTTTGITGHYTLTAPAPGTYRVRVILLNPNHLYSPKNLAGGNDDLDSDFNRTGLHLGWTDSFTIASGVTSISNIDAGIIIPVPTATPTSTPTSTFTPSATNTPTPVNIGDFVWRDLDTDGTQDAGEPGMVGLTVQLWNGGRTILYGSTITDSTVHYTLTAPGPGNYRIRVVLKNSNHLYSPKNLAAGNDDLDSDINRTGTHKGYTDTFTIASGVTVITNIDGGVITPIISASVMMEEIGMEETPEQPVAVVTPTPTAPPTVEVGICAGFRLTAPLSGLPNGATTFSWDPVVGEGITYQIVIMDESRRLLGLFFAQEPNTLSADVSTPVIGGGSQLVVQVLALQNGQTICTDEHLLTRS